jgi:hypothetical protein
MALWRHGRISAPALGDRSPHLNVLSSYNGERDGQSFVGVSSTFARKVRYLGLLSRAPEETDGEARAEIVDFPDALVSAFVTVALRPSRYSYKGKRGFWPPVAAGEVGTGEGADALVCRMQCAGIACRSRGDLIRAIRHLSVLQRRGSRYCFSTVLLLHHSLFALASG